MLCVSPSYLKIFPMEIFSVDNLKMSLHDLTDVNANRKVN